MGTAVAVACRDRGWPCRYCGLGVSGRPQGRLDCGVGDLGSGGRSVRTNIVRSGAAPSQSDTPLKPFAKKLGVMVQSRIHSSLLRARLHRPMPTRVYFSSVDGVGASRDAVMGAAGTQWQDSPLDGHIGEVASRLRELPWRQLVVLGEPGAGKSVLAMTLVDQLLGDWRRGEPVPVLLGLSSWNPDMESVIEFASRRLVEDFGFSSSVARRLVAESRTVEGSPVGWWVMPVLDGLDEINLTLRSSALAAVEYFAAGDRPVVITCRTREFKRTEAAIGVLSRAAVVQLQPLEVEDVIRFLTDPSPHRCTSWQLVFNLLRMQPSGSLAKALSSPLMAGLAKDTFTVADPSELTKMATRSEISRRLIDGYVAVAYGSTRPALSDGQAPPKLLRFNASDAARWLSNLAYLGYLDGTRDLRWWRLPWAQLAVRPVRLYWLPISASIAVLTVAAIMVAHLRWGWAISVTVGLVIGELLGMCAFGLLGPVFAHEFQPEPNSAIDIRRRSSMPTLRVTAKRLNDYVLFGCICGFVAGFLLQDLMQDLMQDLRAAVVAGLACGLALAALPSPTPRRTLGGPAKTLRTNHVLAVTLTVRFAAVAAIVFAAAGYLVGSNMLQWSLVGVVTFAGASLIGSEAVWLRFRVSRLFAFRGRRTHTVSTPGTAHHFLDDGLHPDRATMRVNGHAWQFRHAKIQDHLLRQGRLSVFAAALTSGPPGPVETGGFATRTGKPGRGHRHPPPPRSHRPPHRTATRGVAGDRETWTRPSPSSAATLTPTTSSNGNSRSGYGEQGNLDEAIAILRCHAHRPPHRTATREVATRTGKPGRVAAPCRGQWQRQ